MFGKKKKQESSGGDSPWGDSAPVSNSPPSQSGNGLSGGDAFWGAGSPPSDSPHQGGSPQPTASDGPALPPGAGIPKSVPEMVEPVFLFVCQLNRQVRDGRSPDFQEVSRDVTELLTGIKDRARKSSTMQQQFEKLLQPIHWYLDYLFGSSGQFPSLKSDWNRNRLGEEADDEEGGILTGDEAVFHELDKALAIDPGDKLANERLTFFYNALATGFRGQYSKPSHDNDGVLRDYMEKMYPRVREFIDANPSGRVTPESYNFTDRRDFVAPARDRPLMVICSILCLGMSLLLGYFWLYGKQKEKLESFLTNLRNSAGQVD